MQVRRPKVVKTEDVRTAFNPPFAACIATFAPAGHANHDVLRCNGSGLTLRAMRFVN